MPIIAPHCTPGNWRYESNPFTPSCDWPDDCYVQWGSRGLVISQKGAYRTAFFEAFPKSLETFIRGQGEDVAAAERKAFEKFVRYRDCPSHEFERRHYRNGAGLCKHCGIFKSDVFKPLTLCTVCNEPTTYSMGRDSEGTEHWYCEQHEGLRPRDTQPSAVDAWLDD